MTGPAVFHPVLVAVYPVLFLYSQNIGTVPRSELALPLAIAVGVALSLYGIFCLIFRDRDKAGLLASLLLFLFTTHGHARRLLMGPLDSHAAAGATAIALVLLVLGTWGILRARRRLRPATHILNAMVLFLLVSTALYIVFSDMRPPGPRPARSASDSIEVDRPLPIEAPPASARATLPNIYFIVPDGYGRSDVLADTYGWDNAPFLGWLEEKGFHVASRSHANYSQTGLSLACALNLEYLDALAEREGPASREVSPLRDAICRSRLVEFLKRSGYTTVSFPSGYWLAEMTTADHYVESARDLTEFQSALLAETAVAPLLRAVDWIAPTDAARAVLSPHDAHRARVRRTLTSLVDTCSMDGPLFVYARIFPPHPPFVFGQNGEARRPMASYDLCDGVGWYERSGGSREQYVKAYREQLAHVNTLLKQTIEALLERSERLPIIILQSDHGPASRFDDGDLAGTDARERLGILTACHLPDGGDAGLYDSISPVNTFRVVLNHYFRAGLPLLPDKGYLSHGFTPYRLVDATERLTPAAPALSTRNDPRTP